MLRVLRQGQKWIVGFVVIGVGFVFAFVFGSGGGTVGAPTGGPETVLQVGDRIYQTREVAQLAQQIAQSQRDQLGEDFDLDAARDQINEQAANLLLRTALLAREAEAQGIAASRDEVRRLIRGLPGAVDPDGQFNQAWRNSIESRFGSAARFEKRIRDEILAIKAQRLMRGASHVTDQEARAALSYRTETARIAAVRLTEANVESDFEPADDAVAALLSDDPDRIQASYDARSHEFNKPARVSARHILVRSSGGEAGDGAAEARERIEAARGRIEAGEDFAAVATEVSEDSTASKGGDLGEFGRGAMVREFEDAAFALEPGALSDIIETQFGLHLIQVDEKLAAETISLQEAGEGIARDLLAEDEAAEAVQRLADELSAAIAAGQSLTEAARERELSIARPPTVTRRPDGYVPELGLAPGIMDAAFARNIGSDPTVHELPGGELALIEVLERTTPTEEEIVAQLPTELERMKQIRSYETEILWLESRRADLEKSGELVYNLAALR